jgi:DNA-binding XRE family transcriptional regulator
VVGLKTLSGYTACLNKNESIRAYLKRHLDATIGTHNAIAKMVGMPQSTITRINRGLNSPSIDTAQKLIDFFQEQEESVAKKTRRLVNRDRAALSAAPALGEQGEQ